MNCKAYQDLLQEHLDGADLAPEAEQHLRECPDCAGLAGATRRLRDGLRLLAPPAPSAGLSERIVAQVCAEQAQVRRLRARRRAHRRIRALVGLAAAACLLVAAGIAFFQRDASRNDGNGTDAALIPGPTAPGVGPKKGPDTPKGPHARPVPLRESMAEAGSALAAITTRTAASVGETASLLPMVSPPPMGVPDDLSQPLEPSARPFREAGAELSAGLDPVASSARRAVGLFLRDLPGGAKPAPKANPS